MLVTVDIIIYNGFKLLEATGPLSVFSYANFHLERRGLRGRYDVKIASTRRGEIQSDTGITLQAVKAIDPLKLPHTAIITGARWIEQAVNDTPQIVTWLEAVAHRLPRIAALCTGTFFLAGRGCSTTSARPRTGRRLNCCASATRPYMSMKIASSYAKARYGPRRA